MTPEHPSMDRPISYGHFADGLATQRAAFQEALDAQSRLFQQELATLRLHASRSSWVERTLIFCAGTAAAALTAWMASWLPSRAAAPAEQVHLTHEMK